MRLGRAGYLHRVVELPLILGTGVYAVGLVEVGSAFDGRLEKAQFRNSLTGGLVAETVFGAALIAAAVGDDGSARWFLSIGRLF